MPKLNLVSKREIISKLDVLKKNISKAPSGTKEPLQLVITKLYQKQDQSFYMVKTNYNGKIIKTKMNINFKCNHEKNSLLFNLFQNF